MDFIAAGVLYNQLVRRATRHLATPVEIEELINLANSFPTDLTLLVQELSEKLARALILDTIAIENGLDKVEVESTAVAGDPKLIESKKEKVATQHEIIKIIYNLYQSKSNCTTDVYKSIEKAYKKLIWFESVAQILNADKTSQKPKLSDVEKLLAEFGGTQTLDDHQFPEKKLLDDLFNEARSFVADLQATLKHSIARSKELLASLVNRNDGFGDRMVDEKVELKEADDPEFQIFDELSKEIFRDFNTVDFYLNKYRTHNESRLNLEQIDDILNKASGLALNVDQQTDFLHNEKKLALQLESDIQQALHHQNELTPEILENIRIRNDELVINVPSMESIISILKKFKKWEIQYNIVMRQLEISAANLMAQIREHGVFSSRINGQYLVVTNEMLERLYEQANASTLALDSYKTILLSKIKEARELESNIQRCIESSAEEAELIRLRNEAYQLGVKLKNLPEIEEKIELSRKIWSSIESGSCSVEILKKSLEIAKNKKLETALINDINDKIVQAEIHKQHAIILGSKRKFSLQDVKRCLSLLQSSKESHLDYIEKQNLTAIVSSFKWFFKLAELYLAVETHRDKIIQAKSARQVIENLDGSMTAETFEEMITKCGNSKPLIDLLPSIQADLVELLNEAESIRHLDVRIQELSRHYLQEYWRHKAHAVLSSKILDPSELRLLRERAETLKVNPTDQTFVQIEEKFTKYTTWLDKYTALLYDNDLQSVCDPTVIRENYKTLQELSNSYESLTLTLEPTINSIRYALRVIEWCFAAENCLDRVRDKKKVTYNSIKELFEISHDLRLSKSFFYVEDIAEMYNATQKIIEESLEFFQELSNNSNFAGKEAAVADDTIFVSVDQGSKAMKTDFYDREFQKYPFAKALALSDRLYNSNIIFEKDLEACQNYIQEYQNLSKRTREFLSKYNFEGNYMKNASFDASFYLDRLGEIVLGLDSLKREFSKQIICDANLEFQLLCFEWCLAALLLLHKKPIIDLVPSSRPSSLEASQFKDHSLDSWNSLQKVLAKYAHESSYSILCQQIFDSSVYRALSDTISKAVEQCNSINRMKAVEEELQNKVELSDLIEERNKTRENIKTLPEAKTFLNELENSPIVLQDEIDYLVDLLKRYSGYSSQFANTFIYSKGVKPTLSQVEKLLRNFLLLPLSSGKETALIKAIKAYEILEDNFVKVKETANRSLRNPKKIYSKLAEFIATRSKECPISHPEAEIIEREYTSNLRHLQAIEAYLNTPPQPSGEDVLKKYQIWARFRIDFGIWELNLREQCWFKLTDIIKSQYPRSHEGDKLHPQSNELNKPLEFTYEVLKELLSDGYQFMDNRSIKTVNFKEFKDTIGNLENLINQVEDKLRLIYEKRSIKELDNFPYMAEDFVDLRPQIAIQKERILSGTHEFPKFVSALRNSSRMLQSNPKLYGAVVPKNISVENQKEEEDNVMEIDSGKTAGSKKSKKPKDAKGKSDTEAEEKDGTKKIKIGTTTKVDVMIELQPVGKRLRNTALKDFRLVFEKSGLVKPKLKDKTAESIAKKWEEHIFDLYGNNSPEYSLILKKFCENLCKMNKFSSLSKFVSDNIENMECISSILNEEIPLVELDKIVKSNPSIKPRELIKTAELKPEGGMVAHDVMDDQIKLEDPDDIEQILKELQSSKLPKIHFKADPEDDLKQQGTMSEAKNEDKPILMRKGPNEIFSNIDPQIDGIYQVHRGEFKFSDEAAQGVDGNMVVSLFTCESENDARRVPKLPSSKKCIFKAKVEKKAMDEYLAKLHQRGIPDNLVIVGWFHDLSNDTRTLNKIAEKYQRDGVVGRSKYHDCATLYALHYQDLNLSWTKSNFIQTLKKSSQGVSDLAFVIVVKNYTPKADQPAMEPLSIYQSRLKPSVSKQGQIESDGLGGGNRAMSLSIVPKDESYLASNKQNTNNLMAVEKQSQQLSVKPQQAQVTEDSKRQSVMFPPNERKSNPFTSIPNDKSMMIEDDRPSQRPDSH